MGAGDGLSNYPNTEWGIGENKYGTGNRGHRKLGGRETGGAENSGWTVGHLQTDRQLF